MSSYMVQQITGEPDSLQIQLTGWLSTSTYDVHTSTGYSRETLGTDEAGTLSSQTGPEPDVYGCCKSD